MLRLSMRDGEDFEGETPLDLVRAMKGASMFSDVKDVLHYIAVVEERLDRVEHIKLALTGDKLDDRCESFILELDRLGLAKLEHWKTRRRRGLPKPKGVREATDGKG
ncbi:MAG TPA: hypothetical protein VNE39_21830 [Planctomycetota bacterium]|nr:hypothetical protein [Planctomycetota bacterium]